METGKNKKDIIIRRLRWREIPAFINLRAHIESEAPYLIPNKGERRESPWYVLARMFANKKRLHTFVAVDHKQLVGFIIITMPKFLKLRGNGYLVVSLKSAYQNMGIGTRLMKVAEDFCKKNNIRRLELEVFSNNEKAIALYERLGYQKEGVKRQAILAAYGPDDIVFMAKFI